MTPSLRPQLSALLRFLPSALALIALCACESDRSERRHPNTDSAASAPAKPEPEMRAQGTFFSGQLEVDVVLNRTGFGAKGPVSGDGAPAVGAPSGAATAGTPPSGDSTLLPAALPAAGAAGDSTVASPAGNDTGAGNPGGGRGGGHRHGGGGGGSQSGGYNDSGSQIRPANLQAVSFHMRLVNHAPYPVEVEVTDFNSDLGDFVVEPEKMTLEPNESAEAEPMTSRLGVTSDAIPLTISVRYKGQAPTHQKEKQVLVLKAAPAASAPNPMSPPPLRFN